MSSYYLLRNKLQKNNVPVKEFWTSVNILQKNHKVINF